MASEEARDDTQSSSTKASGDASPRATLIQCSTYEGDEFERLVHPRRMYLLDFMLWLHTDPAPFVHN